MPVSLPHHRSASSTHPEETIRALPLGLLAAAALIVSLVLVRQRQDPLRPERQSPDSVPHAAVPLDLDLVRSAGL